MLNKHLQKPWGHNSVYFRCQGTALKTPTSSFLTFPPSCRRHVLAAVVVCCTPHWVRAQQAQVGAVNEVWTDASRSRNVPVKIRWPSAATAMPHTSHPVVIFSHGLGGTLDGGAVWGEAWAAAGFVVVHVQHAGSDLPAVRSVTSSFTDRVALRTLVGPKQLLARLHDVVFVLDEVERRHKAMLPGWARVRPDAVGLAGHSFGAHTTLGMAGQHYPGFAGMTEPRLAAFIALSPTLPVFGNPTQAFARLTRPLLCITGTRDDDVVGVGATPERRMGVFTALPPGNKGQLVLKDADHMTFGGQTGRAVEVIAREPIARELQAQHHAAVAAITADWWRAYLVKDAEAVGRLGKPAGLAAGDTWERK